MRTTSPHKGNLRATVRKREPCDIFSEIMNQIIVIRNGTIVWKHEPNRSFFLYNLSSENS